MFDVFQLVTRQFFAMKGYTTMEDIDEIAEKLQRSETISVTYKDSDSYKSNSWDLAIWGSFLDFLPPI